MCVCVCVFVSEGFDRVCLQRTLALTTKCCVEQGSQDFAALSPGHLRRKRPNGSSMRLEVG